MRRSGGASGLVMSGKGSVGSEEGKKGGKGEQKYESDHDVRISATRVAKAGNGEVVGGDHTEVHRQAHTVVEATQSTIVTTAVTSMSEIAIQEKKRSEASEAIARMFLDHQKKVRDVGAMGGSIGRGMKRIERDHRCYCGVISMDGSLFDAMREQTSRELELWARQTYGTGVECAYTTKGSVDCTTKWLHVNFSSNEQLEQAMDRSTDVIVKNRLRRCFLYAADGTRDGSLMCTSMKTNEFPECVCFSTRRYDVHVPSTLNVCSAIRKEIGKDVLIDDAFQNRSRFSISTCYVRFHRRADVINLMSKVRGRLFVVDGIGLHVTAPNLPETHPCKLCKEYGHMAISCPLSNVITIRYTFEQRIKEAIRREIEMGLGERVLIRDGRRMVFTGLDVSLASLSHCPHNLLHVMYVDAQMATDGSAWMFEQFGEVLSPDKAPRPVVLGSDMLLCFNCHETGHIRRDCPKAITYRGFGRTVATSAERVNDKESEVNARVSGLESSAVGVRPSSSRPVASSTYSSPSSPGPSLSGLRVTTPLVTSPSSPANGDRGSSPWVSWDDHSRAARHQRKRGNGGDIMDQVSATLAAVPPSASGVRSGSGLDGDAISCGNMTKSSTVMDIQQANKRMHTIAASVAKDTKEEYESHTDSSSLTDMMVERMGSQMQLTFSPVTPSPTPSSSQRGDMMDSAPQRDAGGGGRGSSAE